MNIFPPTPSQRDKIQTLSSILRCHLIIKTKQLNQKTKEKTEQTTVESLWRTVTGSDPDPEEYNTIQFWSNPERTGWLTKQGEYIKTWRRRWFVLKQGKLLWFKNDKNITSVSIPRGVIPVNKCLTVKGAEDILNRQFAFELSTSNDTMYFIADTEKEKEEWINSIGRSIVQHSRSVTEREVVDY